MVKYILLEDEKTGAKLSAGVLATRFIYENNPAQNQDSKISPLVRSAAGKPTLREQENFLLHRLKEFQAKDDKVGANAVMDAMTYFIARDHFQKALNSGEAQIANPGYSGFRAQAFQVARAEDTRLQGVAREKARDDKESTEVARREARTPEQAALEELVQPGHRARIQRVLDQFDGKGLTDNAIRTRLQNQQEGMGWFGDSWDKATALEVFDRAQEIEKGTKAGRPLGGVEIAADRGRRPGAKAAIIPEAKAAQPAVSKSVAAKMKTEDGQTLGGLLLALQEFEGACMSYGSNAQKESMTNILRANEAAISDPKKFQQLFVNLDKAATDKAGEFGGRDYAMARDLLLRARMIDKAQENGQETFKAFTDHGSLSAEYQRIVGQYRASAKKNGFVADGQPVAVAASAASGGKDVPAAPAGDDNEPTKPYKAQTYAATGTPRGTVREAQLLLQAMGESTGKGNGDRFGAGQLEKTAMDGIPGPATDAAIKKFQKANGIEETGALDEATLAKLREVAGLKLEAARAAGGEKTPAPAVASTAADGATSTTVLAQRFAKEIAAVKEATTTPTNYYNEAEVKSAVAEDSYGLVTDPFKAPDAIKDKIDKGIKDKTIKNLEDMGIKLSAQQQGELTVSRGIIYSPLIKDIETALGLAVVDGKMDANLSAILKISELQKVVAEAVGNNSLGQLAALATGGTGSEGPAKG